MSVRRTASQRDVDGGYLLVEALAVLMLSALVLTSLMSFGAGLSSALTRSESRILGSETDGRALETAAEEIARLARRRFAGAGNRFVFSGAPDRIAFAVIDRKPGRSPQPIVVAYEAAEGGGLARSEGRLPLIAEGFGDVSLPKPARLATAGSRIRFVFVEQAEDGQERVLDRWTAASALPAAIRIERRDPATNRLIAARLASIVSQAEPGCAEPEIAFCSSRKPDAQTVVGSVGAAR